MDFNNSGLTLTYSGSTSKIKLLHRLNFLQVSIEI